MTGGGGFLLYLQMHDDPTDLRAVLRDYAQDMVLPALEVYTHGLMADSTMYDAFVAQQATRHPIATSPEGEPMTTRHPAADTPSRSAAWPRNSARCARSTGSI